MLLGHEITVFTDHKNLTYETLSTDHVTRWRFLVEEYGPTIKYIKGVNNVVADELSRIPYDPQHHTSECLEYSFVNETIDQENENDFPIELNKIATEQIFDQELANLQAKNPAQFSTIEMEDSDVVTYKNRIFVLQIYDRK